MSSLEPKKENPSSPPPSAPASSGDFLAEIRAKGGAAALKKTN